MKNKKLLLSLFIFSMVIYITLLTGCHFVQVTTMEDIIGTYKLEYYTEKTKGYEDESKNITVDLKEQQGLEQYIIITGTDKGHLVTKEKDTNYHNQVIKLEYQVSETNEQEIKGIYYRDYFMNRSVPITSTTEGMIQSEVGVISLSPNIYVEKEKKFTKVSNDITLNYIKEVLPEFVEYEEGAFELEGKHRIYFDYSSVEPSEYAFEVQEYVKTIFQKMVVIIKPLENKVILGIKETGSSSFTTCEYELKHTDKYLTISFGDYEFVNTSEEQNRHYNSYNCKQSVKIGDVLVTYNLSLVEKEAGNEID